MGTGGAIPKSARNKKDDEYKLERRNQRIAHMYLKGKSQWEIGEVCGISQARVSEILNDIRAEWKRTYLADYQAKLDQELARLDLLEQHLWEMFVRSQEDAVTKTKRTELAAIPDREEDADASKKRKGDSKLTPVKAVEEETRRGQVGDPRWTEQIRAVCEMRLKILGAFKPDTTKPQMNNIFVNWDQMYDKVPITDPAEEAIAKLLPPATVQVPGSPQEKVEVNSD